MIQTFFVIGLVLILLGVFIIIDTLLPNILKYFPFIKIGVQRKETNWPEIISEIIKKLPHKELVGILLIAIGTVICVVALLLTPAGLSVLEKIIKIKNGTQS